MRVQKQIQLMPTVFVHNAELLNVRRCKFLQFMICKTVNFRFEDVKL